ncbi:MAG: alpha/beta hydrolase [Betaproteobacteria bacterium]|jgi:pimeloyl-ACP methyl ester carboxylesterase|nr:alpha/beta hydrolase [Betaproteobacteria bacterium]
MSDARIHSIACESPAGHHTMRVLEFGDPTNAQVVVCVHGLTRSAFDFMPLAERLATRYRVLCPHVVGRGDSDWLFDPSHYHLGQYAADMQTMAQQLRLGPVHWVGTSMGGLIALTLLGHPQAQTVFPSVQIRSLVLNDVGAVISGKALARIGQYVGMQPVFGSFAQASQAARILFEGFGVHTDAQWDLLAAAVVRPAAWHSARVQSRSAGVLWQPDAACYPRSAQDLHDMARRQEPFQFHYDPEIAAPFRTGFGANAAAGEAEVPDMLLWPLYDAIGCPTLLIRGARSDLLLSETAQEMTRRGPQARLYEVVHAGHAPSLLDEEQGGVVAQFLASLNPVNPLNPFLSAVLAAPRRPP